MASSRRGLPGLPPGDLLWVGAAGAVIIVAALVFGLVPRLVSGFTSGAPSPAPSASPAATVPAADETSVVVKRPADGPLRVAFIGDSLTVGVGATSPQRSFTQIITNFLAGNGRVQADKYARAGATTRQIGQLVPNDGRSDIAIVEAGTNDLLQKAATGAVDVDYGALLDKLRASSPEAALICLGTWNGASSADRYDTALRNQCIAHGGRFIQLSGVYDSAASHGPAGVALEDGELSDGFHPNDTGHLRIAILVNSSIAIKSA